LPGFTVAIFGAITRRATRITFLGVGGRARGGGAPESFAFDFCSSWMRGESG
jgi:hypothetical protein